MAELVDAPGSGPGGGNTEGVRVPFWAPFICFCSSLKPAPAGFLFTAPAPAGFLFTAPAQAGFMFDAKARCAIRAAADANAFRQASRAASAAGRTLS